MNYRLAVLSDVPALSAIEKAQPRCAQWGELGWQTELAEKSSCIWCAQTGKQIAGFAALRLVAGVGEILNVGVSPDFTRRGIGVELVKRVLNWAREHGGRQITLEVGVCNGPAVALYQKAGFTQVGVRKNFYANNEDALIMGCSL